MPHEGEETGEKDRMIYTVTMNPSLDYMVDVKDFKLGLTNRTLTEKITPGGKGINVSMVLKNLGFESTALGFVAGFTGKEFVKQIEKMQLQQQFIEIEQGMTRINVKLTSVDGTEINGCGPKVTSKDLDTLFLRLKACKKGDVIVLAGSLPQSVPKDFYKQVAIALQDREIMLVVDATKETLTDVLPYHPFLIKPNNHEIGEIFGVNVSTRQEVIPYGKKLQQMGAKNVLISLAGEGSVLIAEDGTVVEREAPKGRLINGVGAGDSMVAGFLAGWLAKQDYQYAYRLAASAGSASAFAEGLATKEEIQSVYDNFA